MFFQPSGSSKSSGKRTKRGPTKKLKEGVKYNIEALKPNGEPLAPKKIADKFVRQCGVLVKDQLPISLQEWREPAKDKRQKDKKDAAPRPDVTFVDKDKKSCFGILSWNISPYQIISQKQMCRKSRTLLLGRWRLHSRTTRVVNKTSTSREEGRLQYSREHWRTNVIIGTIS